MPALSAASRMFSPGAQGKCTSVPAMRMSWTMCTASQESPPSRRRLRNRASGRATPWPAMSMALPCPVLAPRRVGVNEREGKTLYNTLLYLSPSGELLGKHRKFRPTGPEKLVRGDGDGRTHEVYDTAVGKLGGLICGEHTMSLPAYTLAAMGEQVHVAAWLGFTLADRSLAEICSPLSRHRSQQLRSLQPAGGGAGRAGAARTDPRAAARERVDGDHRGG